MPTLAAALLQGLKDHGAREIFGIPGDFVLPFFKVIEESGLLPHFTLSHADTKTFFVIHDVSQEALKNAPGFNKDRWPNAADPNWTREVDSYYERTAQRPRP